MTGSSDAQREIARLRERIRQLEAQSTLRAVSEHIPDNLMLLDADERIQFVNWTVPHLTVDEVIGTHPTAYVPEAFHEQIRASLSEVRRTHAPGRYECDLVTPEGEVLRWESRVAPVLSGDELIGFAILSSNITEREQAAADRRRFFDLSLDMLCVATMEGAFRRINAAFTRTLGWSEDELKAMTLLDEVHPEDRQATEQALQRLASGEVSAHFENRYRCKDGSYRVLQWRATAAKERLIFAVARDVTEQQALFAQLLQSQKMEALGKLAGGLAHDFNNHLLAILIHADLALTGSAEEARDALEEVKSAAQRAAELTRQLLAFSRQQTLTKHPQQLDELTEGIARMLGRLLPDNVELKLQVAPDLPPVNGDQGQLEQVLINLCINARDAMPRGGRITIRIDVATADPALRSLPPGRYLRLAVEDRGTGMSREIRERVFEPFFTTKPNGQGTGLGLAIVYGIVEQHGGSIRVDSDLGRGTTFTVYLPACERDEETTPPRPLPLARATPGGSETVLVAEDSEPVRRVLVSLLEEAGYRVLAAADGREALRLIDRHGADLALIDLVMPVLSGRETATAIERSHPDTCILFSSGYRELTLDGSGRTTRLDYPLLHKPYRPDELLGVIRRALDGARANRTRREPLRRPAAS